MADSTKKQSFLHGAALLAAATAIVKVIGAFYKLPLNAIIGTKGFSYFNTAYEIYAVLLMISTAGLPVAMSRMISAANSLHNTRQVKRIYHTAQIIFLTLGGLGAIGMTVFCRQLAQFQQQPDAWVAIGTLGPSVLLISMMSCYRGFFQGQSNMLPTSVSQVLEAVVKLVVGLVAAWLLLKFTNSVSFAAGGAILGVTMSCLVSVLYLMGLFRKAYHSLEAEGSHGEALSYGKTAYELLAIAIPITVGAAGLQLINMIEVRVFMSQLLNTGFTQSAADTMKGILNLCQTVFNMPCSFITPLTISALPAITAALTTCQYDQVRSTEESASRITALIAMPCAIGLSVLARPVMALLGGYTTQELDIAQGIMSILALCVVFNSTVMLTNSIMQAHGHAGIPVIHMIIGGVLKLVIDYVLVGNPDINIIGVPVGTVLCYLCITVLNLIAMNRIIEQPPHFVANMVKPLVSALIMGAAVYGVYWLLGGFVSLDSSIGKLILCGAPILVGVVVYVVCVVVSKAITREDCLLLPKGEKIAKLLKL